MPASRITITLDSSLHCQVTSAARADGKSVSAFVRELIEQRLRSVAGEENCFDLAVRMGIIGAAKGLPRDLSTNRRHFRGFGK